jgi:hypothetical protein
MKAAKLMGALKHEPQEDACEACAGAGWHCSACELPGTLCECDDVERGSATEEECEACNGLGFLIEEED